MINYTRTQWYGLGYLFMTSGSLIPRTLPFVLISGGISLFLTAGPFEAMFGWDAKFFTHPYSMQMFGLVFGYLAISRTNICCMSPATQNTRPPLPFVTCCLGSRRRR